MSQPLYIGLSPEYSFGSTSLCVFLWTPNQSFTISAEAHVWNHTFHFHPLRNAVVIHSSNPVTYHTWKEYVLVRRTVSNWQTCSWLLPRHCSWTTARSVHSSGSYFVWQRKIDLSASQYSFFFSFFSFMALLEITLKC